MKNVTLPQVTLGFLALAAAWAVLPATARAGNELVAPTEVTARYDLAGVARHVFGFLFEKTHSFAPSDARLVAQSEDAALAAIEPASGGEEAAKDEGGHGKEGGEGGGHDPKATGKTEGKKSFTGKVIGVAPDLPEVTVGGQKIISNAEKKADDLESSTPAGLKGSVFLPLLDRRFSITPYAHSPRTGPAGARVTVIEFIDLSCGQCMADVGKIDTTLAGYASTTQVVHIHAPITTFQDTNMPAFYGKIAAKGEVFWPFRTKLVEHPTTDANDLFDDLIASGMNVQQARELMLSDARRFYRELDADAMLARSFGAGNPPVVFVNGIRVGYGGVPLDKLKDVMDYVYGRIQHGLDEPPK